MNTLIKSPVFGSALHFGRLELAALLRMHWWFYLLLAAGGAAVMSPYAAGNVDASSCVSLLVIAPVAIAVARKAIGKQPSQVRTGIVLFVAVLLYWALNAGLISGFEALPKAVSLPLTFILFVPAVWVSVKIALVPASYALQRCGKSFVDAIRDSWDIASDDVWWRVLAIALCVSLVCLVPAQIVAAVALHALMRPYAIMAALFIYNTGSILAAVWSQAAYVALLTAPDLVPRTLQVWSQ